MDGSEGSSTLRRALVALALVAAFGARPVTAPAQDLSGVWVDERGNALELVQSGDRIRVTTPTHVFEGTRSGDRVSVSRTYTSLDDLERQLRDRYGERLVGDRSTMRGTVGPDENVLELTLSFSDRIPSIGTLPVKLTRRVAVLAIELYDGQRRSTADEPSAIPPTLDDGLPFRVELTYATPPAQAPREVTVRWTGGSQSLPLRPSDHPGTWVTPWRYLGDAARRDYREVRGLEEANEDWTTRLAAELFAGRWRVAQTSEEGASASGAAVVAEDGRRVNLVLGNGDSSVQYGSFEILATRDPAGERHTLSVRLEEIAQNGAIADRSDLPLAEVLYVADGTRQLTFEAAGLSLEAPVDSLHGPPRRIRLGLMTRSPGRMAGGWSRESPTGDLEGGGQQTWTRGARIEKVVVLEDQGETDYPFGDGSGGPTTRTLFVYGENLPNSVGDAVVLDSGDSLVRYELAALSGERSFQFRAGWEAAGVSDTTGLSALLVTAHLREGVRPGLKSLVLDGTPGAWILGFADARGRAFFAHQWRESEFQPTATFYSSDVGHLIVDDLGDVPLESLDFTLLKNGQPIDGGTLTLARVGAPEDAEYQSPPIRLFDGSQRALRPPEDASAVSVDLRPGDSLSAKAVDPFSFITVPLEPSVRIAHKPADLGGTWKDALARVAACHGDTGWDFSSITNEEAEEYSRFIFTELGSRSVRINKGDQAAAILIRDELVAMMRSEILPLYEKVAGGDDTDVLEFMAQGRSTGGPFWNVMKGEDGRGTEVPLRDLLDPAGDASRWGMTPEQARRHAVGQVREGVRGFIELMRGSVERAVAAGDCDIEELLVVAGQPVEPIVARILPRLVKLADSAERQYWVPDFLAQGYVSGLHTTGEAVRALDEYASIDDAYLAMALALATGGASFIASGLGYAGTAAYLMIGSDMVDMVYFGGKGVLDYLEGQDLVDFAKGVTPVVGEDFLTEAEMAASEWYWAAVGVIAPGLSGASGLKQLKALRNGEAIARGSALAGRLDELDEASLARFTEAQRTDLAAYFTDLQAKRLAGGVDEMTDAERAFLTKLDAYMESPTGQLRRGLPEDLRHRVPVNIDEGLDARTVRVAYDRDEAGLVTNVRIEAGPGATPRDIELHAETVRQLERYRGVGGRIRRAQDRLANLIRLRKPPPGSAAFEAQEEIRKLPGIIEDRLRELESGALTPGAADDLRAEVAYLEGQLRRHERNLRSWDLNPGRGYVAAESPPPALIDDFQRSEAVVNGTTTRATRQTAEGGTTAVTTAELRSPQPNSRYSVNGYVYETDEAGRIANVEGNLRLDPARRNASQQSAVGRAGADRPNGYVYGESDDGGHLIGSRFNGAGESINMVPQNSALNQNGLWKQTENLWARELDAGNGVRVRIEPYYSQTAGRPDYFDVYYEVTRTANGVDETEAFTLTIRNTRTGQ